MLLMPLPHSCQYALSVSLSTHSHHRSGVGACLGIEDALTLATVLERAAAKVSSSDNKLGTEKVVTDAFLAYDAIRRERSQFGAECAHQTIETYSWRNPETGSDTEKIWQDLEKRWDEMWAFDQDAMKENVIRDFEERLRV